MSDGISAGPAATSDDSVVVFPCKKCGHVFVRPILKVGSLVACSKCGKTNKTVGIALQPRATPEQLRKIQVIARRLSVAFVLFLVSVVPTVVMLAISPSPGPYDAVWGAADIVLLIMLVVGVSLLLVRATSAARLLGHSGAGVLFTFFLLFGVFLVLAAVTLVRLRLRASALTAAGTR